MSKKEGSRFDGLFGAVKTVRQTEESDRPSEALDIQTSRHSNIEASKHSGNGTAKHLDIEAPKQPDTSTSKSKDPTYQRTTIYIPKAMHKKLKAAAAEDEREISAIVEELIQQWLEARINFLDVQTSKKFEIPST